MTLCNSLSLNIEKPRNVDYYRNDLWKHLIADDMNGNYDNNLSSRITNISHSLQHLELLFQLESESSFHIIYLNQIRKTTIIEVVGILEAIFRIYLVKNGKGKKALTNLGFSYIRKTKKLIYEEPLSFISDDFKEKLERLIDLRNLVHQENSSKGCAFVRIQKTDYKNSLKLLFLVLNEFIDSERLYNYRFFNIFAPNSKV